MTQTRIIREGSTGLLILLGIGLFITMALWLKGIRFGSPGYQVTVSFENARGLKDGTNVRYRGVVVGKVAKVHPTSAGVDVQIQIASADVLIPIDSEIQINQSGLIGESFLDITPTKVIAEQGLGKPSDPACDSSMIICNNARVQGRTGASIDELIRVATRLANLVGDPELFGNLKATTKNMAEAAAAVTRLANEVTGVTQTVKQEIKTLSTSVQLTTTSIGQAADQFGLTASQINSLIAANRNTLVVTLDNLSQTSQQLRIMTTNLAPVAKRLEQGELINNLEALAANSAKASANLRDISSSLNSPENLLILQQTLDSARSTFQNVQKITSDLDELTGDPNLRRNIRNLINGLSGLVSTTQQQTELAQILQPLANGGTVRAIDPVPGSTSLPEMVNPSEIQHALSSPSSSNPLAASPGILEAPPWPQGLSGPLRISPLITPQNVVPSQRTIAPTATRIFQLAQDRFIPVYLPAQTVPKR